MLKKQMETERLILRELLPSDEDGIFELDSNVEVHRYLGNNPMETIEQAREIIKNVRQQYVEAGIGRWAVVEKSSGQFIGWSGLKYIKDNENNHHHFYDVGYRLMPKYWGKGYATESARAAINYGFTQLDLVEIFGVAHVENARSRKVLEKCGLQFVEQFMHKQIPCDWLTIKREDWEMQKSLR